jgi:hypothetical protein
MGAPEYRYTDRDVREDPRLEDFAYDYLDTYGGEFEPLVEARTTLAKYGRLGTHQIRVVLNCMRHDWHVANELPVPEHAELAQVVDIDRPKKKFRRGSYYADKPTHEESDKPCGNTSLHRGHTYAGEYIRDGKVYPWEYMHCVGVNNSRALEIEMPLLPKVPYVKARGGKMVHLVGPTAHAFVWHPNQYGWGYNYGHRWGFDPHSVIFTKCRYPSVIRDGILLKEMPVDVLNSDGTTLELCRHCKEM